MRGTCGYLVLAAIGDEIEHCPPDLRPRRVAGVGHIMVAIDFYVRGWRRSPNQRRSLRGRRHCPGFPVRRARGRSHAGAARSAAVTLPGIGRSGQAAPENCARPLHVRVVQVDARHEALNALPHLRIAEIGPAHRSKAERQERPHDELDRRQPPRLGPRKRREQGERSGTGWLPTIRESAAPIEYPTISTGACPWSANSTAAACAAPTHSSCRRSSKVPVSAPNPGSSGAWTVQPAWLAPRPTRASRPACRETRAEAGLPVSRPPA